MNTNLTNKNWGTDIFSFKAKDLIDIIPDAVTNASDST